MRARRLVLAVVWVVAGGVAGAGRAQDLPGEVRLSLLGGPAWQTGAAGRPIQLGMSADGVLARVANGRVGIGALAEGGVFHPAISGKGNYYFSADGLVGPGRPSSWIEAIRLRPYAVAGYTRFFNASSTALNTAHAVNFGVGVDRALTEGLSLRVEVREHYTPGSGSHALVLRVGVVGSWSVR